MPRSYRNQLYPFLVVAWWIACGALGFISYESRLFWIAGAIWLIGGIVLAIMIDRWARAEVRVNRLEHNRRKQTEFIALAVHELNTPLAALRGRLDMLLREDMAGLTPRQRRQFAPLLTASDRLDALVGDLLDSARLDAGRFRLQRIDLDLRPLLQECWQEVAPLLPPQAAHRLRLPAGQLPYRGDPTRLRQIVRNLLNNAAKYADGRPVTLTVVRRPAEYEIAVQDRGFGLEQKDLLKIGSRFFAGSSPNRQPGTGLGLFIVKQLVQQHGGRLVIESKGVNRGLTAQVFLPYANPVPPPPLLR